MRRVLTRFGLGTTDSSGTALSRVLLDTPHLGETVLRLDDSEVFPFSNWAIVRVINATGPGLLSNLQFYESRETAELAVANTARSPDETWILIDFQAERAKATQGFGVETPRFLYLHPRVHLWGREVSPFDQPDFGTPEEAVAAFDDGLIDLIGAAGINAPLLFDTQKGKVLRLVVAIAPPQGIIVDWKKGDLLPVAIPD